MTVYFLWHGHPAKGGFLLAARVKEPEKAQVVTIPIAEPVTSKHLYIKRLRETVCDISLHHSRWSSTLESNQVIISEPILVY